MVHRHAPNQAELCHSTLSISNGDTEDEEDVLLIYRKIWLRLRREVETVTDAASDPR